MGVPIEQELLVGIVSQGAEGGFSAAIDGAVSLDELDGRFELLARQFRKAGRDGGILKREIINAVAGGVLPAPNPERAEIAIAVKNHQRPGRRRCD